MRAISLAVKRARRGELTVADFPLLQGAVRVIEDFSMDIFTEMSGHTWESALPYRRWWRSADLTVPFLDAVATPQHLPQNKS